MRLAELDAVTLDAHGTLVSLVDPVPSLREALRRHGVSRDEEEVRAAFAAEVAYYRRHMLEGRDQAALAALRERCADVFLDHVGVPGDGTFTAAFLASLAFEPLPGVRRSLVALRARGLALAVVSNWDAGLEEHLRAAGLAPLVDIVVTSAEAGTEKPDPAIFGLALRRLHVRPDRTLHVGDGEEDEAGATAAGMRFARAPLREVVRRWA